MKRPEQQLGGICLAGVRKVVIVSSMGGTQVCPPRSILQKWVP
jgi:hypothetical protein